MDNPMYDTLLCLPVFQGMTAADFNSLLQKIRLDFVRYAPGQVIITEGDRCSSFAFLINGTVLSSRGGQDDRFIFQELVCAPHLIEPYSMFGRSNSYQRTYTAQEQCSLLFVDKQYVYTEIGKYNICRMNMLNMLSGRVQQLDSFIWSRSEMTLRQRIVRFISGLSDVSSGEKHLQIKMNDLAALMDATRINVSRELNAMADSGLINLRRGGIFIPALEKLN
ncbi:MAG: Crp/Fnr family transcriptional regulator [Bacteroidetes bacterium]|nr:Crp/Fnr family transcriptional regulator [Candidatus Colenecus caballi]